MKPKVTIGYHASHEQFPPGMLLGLARKAEDAGFGALLSSDHFNPWTSVRGESGFSWAWLGAALQATSLPAGVVCTPGYRYHPAIVAQAAATLAGMLPGRFWIAIGTGQAESEGICGEAWPPKSERNDRLFASATIMRSLWAGETVTTAAPVRTVEARLHTRPTQPPLLLGAALTPATAEWLGGWADGLITVAMQKDDLAEVVEAFRHGGGEGKPMYLKVDLSYARTDEEARSGAWDQWRANVYPAAVLENLRTPGEFEALEDLAGPRMVFEKIRISADPKDHVRWLRTDIDLGFTHLYLHNVNRNQETFIEDFGNEVLPEIFG
jgi:coenzyme F420-dependent glucose-6-phosphate dehydrogenase